MIEIAHRFQNRHINIGDLTWYENLTFEGCVLQCEEPKHYLRLRNCQFVACFLVGSGWPEPLKNMMNGPYLEQLAAQGEKQ